MPAAAQGGFEPPGKLSLHFRPYNVSADTGAFELRSRAPAPDASTPLSVEVRPARRSTCTHSPYRACPCAHFLRGGLLVPSLPCPSRPMHTTMQQHFAEGRLGHARMTLLVYACECVSDMRVHDHRSSFAFTGCAVCTCPYREDATCMRRYLRAGASAKDSSGALMRAQTQSMRCAHSHGRCVRM